MAPRSSTTFTGGTAGDKPGPAAGCPQKNHRPGPWPGEKPGCPKGRKRSITLRREPGCPGAAPVALGGTIELGARRWDTRDSGHAGLTRAPAAVSPGRAARGYSFCWGIFCHSFSPCAFS